MKELSAASSEAVLLSESASDTESEYGSARHPGTTSLMVSFGSQTTAGVCGEKGRRK